MLIYDGLSLLDDEPIIVVAIPEYSKKIGTMLCTWIILRDVDPREAAYDGRDESICGGCVFRAKNAEEIYAGRPQDLVSNDIAVLAQRACYVRPHLEPWIVWTKYHDDEYPDATGLPGICAGTHAWRRRVNPARLPVRIGSYGDPAAVPIEVWRELVATADRYTGYSHLWDDPRTDPALKKYCMASVDNLEQRDRAQAAGWRTFLVVAEGGTLPPDDIICPASKAGGSRTTCDRCRLCMATSIGCEKSISIFAHGPGKEFV